MEHRVPRDCLERAFKDQRGSQDSRGSRAPGGPQDKVFKGIRETGGSWVNEAEKGTGERLERQERLDLWADWEKKGNLA